MSDVNLCKYANKVFIGILDNYPKDSLPMNYDTIEYYDKALRGVVNMLQDRFIAKAKRTLKEWPICTNGGTVNIVFVNGAGYFKCDKCKNKNGDGRNNEFTLKPEESRIVHFQGWGKEESYDIKPEQIVSGEIRKALGIISIECPCGGAFSISNKLFREFPIIKDMCSAYAYNPVRNFWSCVLKNNYWVAVENLKKHKEIAEDKVY